MVMSKYFKDWVEADEVLGEIIDKHFKLKLVVKRHEAGNLSYLAIEPLANESLERIPPIYRSTFVQGITDYVDYLKRTISAEALLSKYNGLSLSTATNMLNVMQKKLNSEIILYEQNNKTTIKADAKAWLDIKYEKKESVDPSLGAEVSSLMVAGKTIKVGDILIGLKCNYKILKILKQELNYAVVFKTPNRDEYFSGFNLAKLVNESIILSEVN